MLVCDTGPLVAAALHADIHHHECVELFSGMRLADRDLVLPTPVIAEVGYLLAREASADVESSFLRSLADRSFKPVELTSADYARMADLVDQYADFPLGLPTPRLSRSPSDWTLTRSRRSTTVTSPWCGPVSSRRSPCCPDRSLWTE